MMWIGGLIAPGLFTQVFAWAISGVPADAARLPGAPFLVAAALLDLAAPVAWRVTGRIPVRAQEARDQP